MPLRLLLLWAAACQPPGGSQEAAYLSAQGEAFGAGWRVQWQPVDGADVPTVQAAVVDDLSAIDLHLSTWRDDSELAAVRRGPGRVPVSEETAIVVQAALDLAEITGGAYDPTVQPLMELWGLAGKRRDTWPTDAEIEAARAQVGHARVTVGHDATGAWVDAGGTALDVSSIAPGYAADRVLWTLAGMGVLDAYVDIGGEIRVAGRAPRGGPWRVGIEAPEVGSVPGSNPVGIVGLVNGGLATSGNYRTRYLLEGREVHHTMDPRTGRPSTASVLSATVVASDARTADGWATALMVLGEAGLPLAEAQPMVEAWLVLPGAHGPITRGTSGIGARLHPSAGMGAARPAP